LLAEQHPSLISGAKVLIVIVHNKSLCNFIPFLPILLTLVKQLIFSNKRVFYQMINKNEKNNYQHISDNEKYNSTYSKWLNYIKNAA